MDFFPDYGSSNFQYWFMFSCLVYVLISSNSLISFMNKKIKDIDCRKWTWWFTSIIPTAHEVRGWQTTALVLQSIWKGSHSWIDTTVKDSRWEWQWEKMFNGQSLKEIRKDVAYRENTWMMGTDPDPCLVEGTNTLCFQEYWSYFMHYSIIRLVLQQY